MGNVDFVTLANWLVVLFVITHALVGLPKSFRRRRNRIQGAGKISAHASGLTADVASFELANGRTS